MIDEFHIPVLSDKVVEYLNPERDGIYIDCTIGGGGHAKKILERLSAKSRLIGFDRDAEAIAKARNYLLDYKTKLTLVNDNFANLCERLKELKIEKVQGMLLDLGVSSYQLNNCHRGFSFQVDSHLDMRMDTSQLLDGWTVINKYELEQLANIFRNYGEDFNFLRIAKRIVEVREKKSINTTKELVEIIGSVVGKRFLVKTLARIFQAIRIEVNNELNNLKQVLKKSVDVLDKGGRIVVISYHSLEDRIVKQFFKNDLKEKMISDNMGVEKNFNKSIMKVLTKKPVKADETEIKYNKRARSAKLRAAERL